MAIQLGGGEGFSLRHMHKTQNNLMQGFERLSTQKRINSAADDAAGLAIAQRMLASESAMARGVRNLNDGISVSHVAEGGLTQVSNDLGRMRELAVQAQNGTLNDDDRAVIQQEIDQLAANIDQTVASTEFNGQKLLDGSQAGASAMQFTGGSGQASVELAVDDQSTAALGVSTIDVRDPASIAAIDAAIDQVASSRGDIGATANRLASEVRSELVQQENVAAARSRIEDVDFAEAVSEQTRNQVLLHAQLGLQAHTRLDEAAVVQLLG